MKFFLAGIMQGSHHGAQLHKQDYRGRLRELLVAHVAGAEVYDPLANHRESLGYDESQGRQVFFHHNRMCGASDVVIAFVPEATMGTAIEMWEAFRHGQIVVTISPLALNWAVKFLSHLVYGDVATFEAELISGRFTQQLSGIREQLDSAGVVAGRAFQP
jgi:hypothetical protein